MFRKGLLLPHQIFGVDHFCCAEMCLKLHNHLCFDNGNPAVRCKLLTFFLLSEVDADWAGQVRRLLELFLVFEHEAVVNFCVVVKNMV